jgi:hypothetical protein
MLSGLNEVAKKTFSMAEMFSLTTRARRHRAARKYARLARKKNPLGLPTISFGQCRPCKPAGGIHASGLLGKKYYRYMATRGGTKLREMQL